MSIIRNAVLLLKSEKSGDKYEDLLKLHNFQVTQLKTLDFIYKNIDKLAAKLSQPDDFSGIIFSSPRCVNAVEQATRDDKKLRELWGSKLSFAVGETTGREAGKLGFQCLGQESGNAKKLAQIIIQTLKNCCDKPLLFPHGNLKTDTLKLELGKEGITLDEALVYETVPNADLENEFQGATEDFSQIPEFVVFFSPSGFNCTIDLIRRVSLGDPTTIKFVAIGPVTELAIQEEGLPVYAVCQSPTPEEVLKAVSNKP